MDGMDQNEKVAACLNLARFSAEMMNSRRDIEWKITVSLWTLLAVGVAFLAGKPVVVPYYSIVIIWAVHCLWLRGMYVGFQNDHKKAYHFREQAEALALDGGHQIKPSPDRIKRWGCKWCLGFLVSFPVAIQYLGTLALSFAACILTRLLAPLQQPLIS